MSIIVQWDNPEKTIIRQKFEGRWTSTEYQVSLDELSNLLKDVNYRVHLIGDMTHSVGIPVMNLLAVSGRVVRMVERQLATITVVKTHKYFQALVNMVRQMSPTLAESVYFVNTLDEAYTILAKRTETTSVKAI